MHLAVVSGPAGPTFAPRATVTPGLEAAGPVGPAHLAPALGPVAVPDICPRSAPRLPERVGRLIDHQVADAAGEAGTAGAAGHL